MKRPLFLGVLALLAVALGGIAWSLSRGPSFSWKDRLPARYRLHRSAEISLLYAAKARDRAHRVWVYESPYDVAGTLRELRRAFPKAQVRKEFAAIRLLLDGEDGPELAFARKRTQPVWIYASGEGIAPGPIPTALAAVLPVREPVVTEYPR